MDRMYPWRATALAMPAPAPVSSLDEAIQWYDRHLRGRTIVTADGMKVYCPPGLGRHLATEREHNTEQEGFAAARARKMTRIEPTIKHGRTYAMRDKDKCVIAGFFVSRDGRWREDYMVVARRQGKRLVLNTAFDPRSSEYLRRTILEPREEP